ncbi:uncharacterized protein [Musca autumnalis]|uniref:uncharacterized protein n=1 Tax=Musca autumnalis TaxID=221902 RepID=UPI003CF825E9
MSESHLLQAFLRALNEKNNHFDRLPRMILRDVDVNKPLYDIVDIRHNALVLTLLHSVHDTVLNATARATRNRRSCFTIYLLHTFTYAHDHRHLFEELWKYQFRRPLVIANGQDLLTMDPYPALKIVNVTSQPMSTWFPIIDKIRDFKGYTVHMPVQTDIPTTYFYMDEITKKYKADGLAAWIVIEFMSRLNVSLDVYPLNVNNSYFINVLKIFELLRSGEVEISPHLMTILSHEDNIDFSYPFISTSRCVMVPRPKKFTIDLYGFINWKLFLFVSAFMMLYEVLWKFYPIYSSRVHRGYSWLRLRPFSILCVLLGIPIPQLPLPSFTRLRMFAFVRLIITYFIIAFSGLYISQLFSTNLTSILTANSVKGTPTQLEDIFSGKIPIMTRAYDAELFAKLFKVGRHDMKNIMETSYKDIQNHRSQLNSSFMYLVTKEEYLVFDEQQRYLHPKRFKLSNICHGPYPMQIQLRADSHFLRLFHLFILFLRESGLYEYQKRTLFARAKKHGKLDYIHETEKSPEFFVTFNTLSAMLCVLSVGYTTSIVVFIFELYGERIRRAFKGNKFIKKLFN